MAEAQVGRNDGLFDMEKELTCSICTDILYQPLTLLDCLHTFCGSCLSEWFAWQAASAASNRRSTHPYTCPSCRESVRGSKADWRLTTLLEGFLKANPDRAKSEAEKEQMRKHYKPGDDVIPKVEIRRDQSDSEDERLLAEVRELSMANVDPETARRRAERAARHGRHRRRPDGSSSTQYQQARLTEAQLQRHNAHEPHVEHQPSLRSLLSASPIESQDVQQEILQSIYAEGLLEGIDIDNLTPEQEEQLTERIAEAYRRRQRRRDRSANRERGHDSNRSEQALVVPSDTADSRAPAHRDRTDSPAARSTQPRARPPVSRPHLFEQSNTSSRRSPSATSQRSGRATQRLDAPAPVSQASRSATDLSNQPRTDEAERERRRRASTNARSTTDPTNENLRADIRRIRAASNDDRQVHSEIIPAAHAAHPLEAMRQQAGPSNNSLPSLLPSSGLAQDTQHSIRPAASSAAFAPEPVNNAEVIKPAPSISCSRCEKQEIQHDLHYHCPWCRNGKYNLCLTCYRSGQGCDHWYGFGFQAYERWHRLAPPEGWPPNHGRPHTLSARRYIAPSHATPSAASDRNANLQEGAFCESCFAFADSCYWYCTICQSGAWGFCDTCVRQGRHCDHPLLPVAHLGTIHHQSHRGPPKPSFVQMPHLRQDSYVDYPVTTECDICHRPISPNSTRFHCYQCSQGDYDVCTECYYSLVATGKISTINGPNGWRRCLQSHRMAIVGYQDAATGGHARVTVRDIAGGWRHKDDGNSTASDIAPPPGDSSLGARCLALWSYFPKDGVQDELAFPKNAEVTEVEDMNGEWSVGVYAGNVGLFPSNHVRRM